MAEKLLLSKSQAVSVLQQIKDNKEIDINLPVKDSHPLLKASIVDLEKRLVQYLGDEQFAGIAEEV